MISTRECDFMYEVGCNYGCYVSTPLVSVTSWRKCKRCYINNAAGYLSNLNPQDYELWLFKAYFVTQETYVMRHLTKCIVFVSCFPIVSCASEGPDQPNEPGGAEDFSAHPEIPNPTLENSEVALNCDIAPAIDWMTEQTITYTQDPADEWRDCSGNFLRLSSRIASICPNVDMAAPAGIKEFDPDGDNKRPGAADARSTRALAKWYDERELFVPVYYDDRDATLAPASLTEFRNDIRPGTVFWFSFEVPKSNQGKENLYMESADGKGVIGHMGTVVSVERDVDDNVTSWTMYHGQNSRKNNGITTHRWDKSTRSPGNPQGGWGEQRIVGYASHLVPELAALD